MVSVDARRGLLLLVGRALAFQAVFLVLHFAYDWWPGGFTAVFSGIDESVFQHMKVGYFSWLVVSALEWVALRPGPALDFAASRLLGAAFIPPLFAGIWYLAAAVAGPMPTDLAEIVWANVVIFAASLFTLDIEDHIGSRPMSARLKAYAFALAALACFSYVRFSLDAPWVDLFEIPEVTR
ncbi:MAG: hypothetical protein KKA67_06920 [Spirochaetes bacterium]|nr:hypothetical protein [Spirochaetota bacterium]MBU1081939.1 hypothetical protein [Spirochaetota bacterium]